MGNYLRRRAKFIKGNSKGMTLVEVIVALVIAMIVIGLSAGMLISSTNIFNSTATKVEDERVASTILNFVKGELRYATQIKTVESAQFQVVPQKGTGLIYTIDKNNNRTEKGMIAFKRPSDADSPRNVYGESFFNERKIGIRMQTLKADRPKVIRIFIDVYRNDELVYVDSATFEVPNIPDKAFPTTIDDVEPTKTVLLEYEPIEEEIEE